ncbi:MAG: adenine phosphoribosyltransferase [Actinobacteria bacterium]|nr:MAG: adenine phosphoribosyltransferase [Actinomycetota bacterium]
MPVDLQEFVREIPDFPRPGIGFKDITPLLLNPGALDAAVEGLAEFAREQKVDFVVAAEARGFILGGALARELGAGFIPARKPGKLPHETISAEYALEYGLDELEMHSDALAGGARVLIHDDLLATGGTARALCDLVAGTGAEVVGCAFLVELGFLNGRARLEPYRVRSLIEYSD